MRARLLDACRFDWSDISPAIFGALFQSVMDPVERRAQGAHYTTERNILKVIGPLFLDDLRAEFERIKARRRGREAALQAFYQRLGEMTFFDPACGCGNFLIIAYRELRLLEIEVLRELRAPAGGATGASQLVIGRGGPLGRQRRSVLRHRDRRVSRPHCRNRAVDDGPHHEQPAESGIRPDLRPHPAAHLAPRPARRRAGDGLGGGAAPRTLFLRIRQSALRRREVPDGGAACAGAPGRGPERKRRDARLR